MSTRDTSIFKLSFDAPSFIVVYKLTLISSCHNVLSYTNWTHIPYSYTLLSNTKNGSISALCNKSSSILLRYVIFCTLHEFTNYHLVIVLRNKSPNHKIVSKRLLVLFDNTNPTAFYHCPPVIIERIMIMQGSYKQSIS